MAIFNKGTAIGKAIAGRVKGFPVWEKEPKKKPRRKPTCWALCPDFRVKAPKVISAAGAEKDYSFTVQIFSTSRKECLKALDHMIDCAQQEIDAGSKRFWLYAVIYGIQHTGLFRIELSYTFRVRQIPEEI